MELNTQNSAKIIKAEDAPAPITIDYRRRHVSMCYVFEHELRTIGTVNSKTSLYFSFFGASIGAAFGLGITLATVVLENPFMYAGFCAGFLVFALATLVFGILSIIEYRKSSQEVNRILEESKHREMESI